MRSKHFVTAMQILKLMLTLLLSGDIVSAEPSIIIKTADNNAAVGTAVVEL